MKTFIATFLLIILATAASAQQDPGTPENPRAIPMTRRAPSGQLLAAAAPKAAGEAVFDLNVVYTASKLWNPATMRYDAVRLRSYQGTSIDPEAPYVSPLIEVVPGDTIRMTLNNQLPPDPDCTSHGSMNVPHCFNGTNLHTHGLWVNPAGNGDNVLISINPGVSFQYEYKIPPDHPAGTFWYHTHRHGSTALQVSSGMAGALIVRGSRFPTESGRGDIDTLLRSNNGKSFTERVLVMQQIQYACRDAQGKVKTNPDGTYRCDAGDVGAIESYDQFGPGSWAASGRYTSLNGRVLPTFQAKSGQLERWRMIHGGVRDTINLQFRRMKEGALKSAPLSALKNEAFIAANCTGPALTQYVIAADGLTLAAVKKSSEVVFQPGYRWDSLVVFPEPATYCVIDGAAPASANVSEAASSRQLLGFVSAAPGSTVSGDLDAYVKESLLAAAAANMPDSVKARVTNDLKDSLKLSSFVWHPDVRDDEVTGTQELVFNIDTSTTPPKFEVNGQPYDAGRIDRVLKLGGVDEWHLRSDFVSHPFHIHINPFQVVKILDPNGKDVSAPGAVDDAGGTADPQYPGLKGVWKDTLWVKNLVPPGKAPGQYTIVVRTRYERYIGDFVLHCHILDHEDQGMMQNVRIALPDGAGGVSAMHH